MAVFGVFVACNSGGSFLVPGFQVSRFQVSSFKVSGRAQLVNGKLQVGNLETLQR